MEEDQTFCDCGCTVHPRKWNDSEDAEGFIECPDCNQLYVYSYRYVKYDFR